MKSIGRILAVIALASITSTSFAAVRGFHARAGNLTLPAGAAFIPLNAAGATIVGFNLPVGGNKVLTFSFECSVDAAPAIQTRRSTSTSSSTESRCP